MGIDFKKIYNKGFAEPGSKLNQTVNKAIGKDVFKDIKKMEDPKVFPEFSTYAPYEEEEPEQWPVLEGEEKTFEFQGIEIKFSKNLDTCLKYTDLFKLSADYYAKRFKFRYGQCVKDYDSFLNYFEEMYFEGLSDMIKRAYSLLLPVGVFDYTVEKFFEYHVDNYCLAIQSFEKMMNIVDSKNKKASETGESIGNSLSFRGGGFGLKGAMKGMAQAEALNAGMTLIGKYFSNQMKMSEEEKSAIFSKFKEDIFFKEVYSDYLNTIMSLIQVLSEKDLIGLVSTRTGEDYNTIIDNVTNPLFPEDKVAPVFAELLEKYPFTKKTYDALEKIYGDTDEIKNIREYFYI